MTLKLSRPVLLGADAPRVLTTAMLEVLLCGPSGPPSRKALFNWIHTKEGEGALYRVTRGVYLNQLATPPPSPQEAVDYVRAGAIVSLQKVLGDACVLNNYTTVVTCVVPWTGSTVPRVGRVRTVGAEFQFHAMPRAVVHAGRREDRLVPGITYARATPERALLDWIRLGSSRHRSIAPPPLDVELDLLDHRRLDRLARAMDLTDALGAYHERVKAYYASPEVQENAGMSWSGLS